VWRPLSNRHWKRAYCSSYINIPYTNGGLNIHWLRATDFDRGASRGAVDVQAPNVETGEQVADRIRVHSWLAPEQTMITSTCGFNHLPRHIALGKLQAMTKAREILRGGKA